MTANRKLRLPPGTTLDQMMFEWPDEPLGNISMFDRLYLTNDKEYVGWLSGQLDSQQVIDVVLSHHGEAGLYKVLRGVAYACSRLKIPMSPRLRSIATFHGFEVV